MNSRAESRFQIKTCFLSRLEKEIAMKTPLFAVAPILFAAHSALAAAPAPFKTLTCTPSYTLTTQTDPHHSNGTQVNLDQVTRDFQPTPFSTAGHPSNEARFQTPVVDIAGHQIQFEVSALDHLNAVSAQLWMEIFERGGNHTSSGATAFVSKVAGANDPYNNRYEADLTFSNTDSDGASFPRTALVDVTLTCLLSQ